MGSMIEFCLVCILNCISKLNSCSKIVFAQCVFNAFCNASLQSIRFSNFRKIVLVCEYVQFEISAFLQKIWKSVHFCSSTTCCFCNTPPSNFNNLQCCKYSILLLWILAFCNFNFKFKFKFENSAISLLHFRYYSRCILYI